MKLGQAIVPLFGALILSAIAGPPAPAKSKQSGPFCAADEACAERPPCRHPYRGRSDIVQPELRAVVLDFIVFFLGQPGERIPRIDGNHRRIRP